MKKLIVILLLTPFLVDAQNPEFLIQKNQAGPIKLGMSYDDAIDKVIELGYDTVSVAAWHYLVDGGGNGIEVSKDGEVLLFFWKFWNDNLVHGLYVISPKYKTAQGISTDSTVDDLLKVNADYKVEIEVELTSTEYIVDDALDALFIFLTKDDNRIGEYNYEKRITSSTPKVKSTSIDWIGFWQSSFD